MMYIMCPKEQNTYRVRSCLISATKFRPELLWYTTLKLQINLNVTPAQI
jgi:hypothetical protein